MKYQKLEGDQAFYIVPPNINAMMTGVQYAAQDKSGTITLTYTDGETESADCSDLDINDIENGIFGITSLVQTRARENPDFMRNKAA